MKALSRIVMAVALIVGFMAAGTVSAAEETLRGTLVCAKCKLNKSEKCQDALLVTDEKGATTEYWVVKNEAAEKAGHQCKSEAKATVTGEVSEKDGKKWIAASKIEKSQQRGARRPVGGAPRSTPKTPALQLETRNP